VYTFFLQVLSVIAQIAQSLSRERTVFRRTSGVWMCRALPSQAQETSSRLLSCLWGSLEHVRDAYVPGSEHCRSLSSRQRQKETPRM